MIAQGADIIMPYGAGPHICLGAGMGEAMLLLALATIIREFDLAPTNDEPPRYVFDPSLTLDPAVTLRVR